MWQGSIPAWAGKPWASDAGHNSARVYPRVGGETRRSAARGHSSRGLSPRGRGNPATGDRAASEAGSIPAWAGKPRLLHLEPPVHRVYPRVGGETHGAVSKVEPFRGLSPRGRGNLITHIDPQITERSIPAWAGKPLCHNDPVSQEIE